MLTFSAAIHGHLASEGCYINEFNSNLAFNMSMLVSKSLYIVILLIIHLPTHTNNLNEYKIIFWLALLVKEL